MHIRSMALGVLLAAFAGGCVAEDEPDTGSTLLGLANPDGTVVCHKGHEIDVAFPAVSKHLSHGDFLGPCLASEAASSSVLMCHVKGKRPHEIEVAFPAVD